jgi:hypothetical protein
MIKHDLRRRRSALRSAASGAKSEFIDPNSNNRGLPQHSDTVDVKQCTFKYKLASWDL